MYLARIIVPATRPAMMSNTGNSMARPLSCLLSQQSNQSQMSPISSTPVARSLQTSAVSRDSDSAAKFIGAGERTTSINEDVENRLDLEYYEQQNFRVPISWYNRAMKRIGMLETRLDLYQGFFLAEIVRCTLEKFIEKILKPQNYLKPETKETAENIEKAFVAFLSDDTNDLAVQLKKLLISLDIVVIANCSRLSYKKTSKIVHRALESYLDDYDVTALYTSLEKAPRLKDQEKLVVNKILELLYNNNLL